METAPVIHGKSILLIDDIVTTGATVYEASRPLINAGVRMVDVFSIAYAP
jgi:predicted amidophosphoribosyltransferase